MDLVEETRKYSLPLAARLTELIWQKNYMIEQLTKEIRILNDRIFELETGVCEDDGWSYEENDY